MKIAVLGDLHFISESDPLQQPKKERAFFKDAWGSYLELASRVRQEAPDLVISLGDLVDWYSEPNVDFACELLEHLACPWVVTPGNHDLALYREAEDGRLRPGNWPEGVAKARAGWTAKGIELGNRVIDAGDTRLILLESPLSCVPEGTQEWLATSLRPDGRNIVFTHVPLNLPAVATYIHSVDPRRNLKKYVQSGAPGLFESSLRGLVQSVFTGHLHFPGRLSLDGTEMHMLPLGIVAANRQVTGQGQATILDLNRNEMRQLSLASVG